jgi:pyrroloquinoline quinone biosynthesis protein B
MWVRVLGSAAGGGLPQWNCRCANCVAARDESARDKGADVVRRTQSSLAISGDGRCWYLLNVSPDVRQQILDFPELAPPSDERRGTSLAGAVLTDAEIDHTTGLLLLREGCELPVYSTQRVRDWLTEHYPIRRILSHFAPRDWRTMELGESIELTSAAGVASGLSVCPFEVDRHVPRFVPAETGEAVGSVIGLEILDAQSGGKLVYAPCVASINDLLRRAAERADAVFVDGTFWDDDEPIRHAVGERTARQMGHLPASGPGGSLEWLESLGGKQRYYVHINNTNPMLRRSSAEHEAVTRAGIRVAEDGDRVEL